MSHQDEIIDPPQYVGYRIADGPRMLTCIARIERRDRSGHLWGYTFSEKTPQGDYGIIPLYYVHRGIDAQWGEPGEWAEGLIAMIRAGQTLPAEVVNGLREV
jgi:hypothetical protein